MNHLSLNDFTQIRSGLLVEEEEQPNFETENATMAYKKITIWEDEIKYADCDVDSEENTTAQQNGVRLELLLPITITTETVRVVAEDNLVDYITDAHCGECHCCLPDNINSALKGYTTIESCKGNKQYAVSKWYEEILDIVDWVKEESMNRIKKNKQLDDCYAIIRCLRHLIEEETLKDVKKSDIVEAVEKGVLLTAYARNTIQKILLREWIEKTEKKIEEKIKEYEDKKAIPIEEASRTRWADSPIITSSYSVSPREE